MRSWSSRGREVQAAAAAGAEAEWGWGVRVWSAQGGGRAAPGTSMGHGEQKGWHLCDSHVKCACYHCPPWAGAGQGGEDRGLEWPSEPFKATEVIRAPSANRQRPRHPPAACSSSQSLSSAVQRARDPRKSQFTSTGHQGTVADGRGSSAGVGRDDYKEHPALAFVPRSYVGENQCALPLQAINGAHVVLSSWCHGSPPGAGNPWPPLPPTGP